MNKKQRMYERIQKHGEELNAIFETEIEPVALCKKLMHLERKAHHATTCLNNTNTLDLLELNRFTGYDVKQETEEEQDNFFLKIEHAVINILGTKASMGFFINYDPRGYALKLKPQFMLGKKLHQDWGGNGILAPEFDGEK